MLRVAGNAYVRYCGSVSCYMANCSLRRDNVKRPQSKGEAIAPVNVSQLMGLSAEALADTPYYGLLLLLSEMCDAQAKGENVYITIGANMDRTSVLLTLTQDGVKTRAGGTTLIYASVDASESL